MAGFNAQQATPQVQTGNQVAVLVGDTVLMFAQSVGLVLPMGAEQLYGIGTAKPQEIPQLRMSPSVSLSNFKLTEAGLVALQGSQNLAFILTDNQFDISVYDGITKATMMSYVGCKAQNYSQNIPTNSVIQETVSFLALDVLNGAGESIMDSALNAIEVLSNLATGAVTLGLNT